MEDVITVGEAAKELKVTAVRVRVLIRTGRLKAEKFGDSWMIPRAGLAKVRNASRAGRKRGRSVSGNSARIDLPHGLRPLAAMYCPAKCR